MFFWVFSSSHREYAWAKAAKSFTKLSIYNKSYVKKKKRKKRLNIRSGPMCLIIRLEKKKKKKLYCYYLLFTIFSYFIIFFVTPWKFKRKKIEVKTWPCTCVVSRFFEFYSIKEHPQTTAKTASAKNEKPLFFLFPGK